MSKKIVIFDGGGGDGLEITTPNKKSWDNDRKKVLNYFNNLKMDFNLKPKDKHILLYELSKNNEVTIITTSILDLHERAGSTDILHLHGELTKKRNLSTNEILNWEYGDLLENDEDLPEKFKFRPHVVLFGEMPYNVEQSNIKLKEADYLVIIGTSLQIGYVTPLLATVNPEAKVYFINPEKVSYLDAFLKDIEYIEKGATEGMKDFINDFINDLNGNL